MKVRETYDPSYLIEVSHAEAKLIVDVLYVVGGQPTTRRGLADSIRKVLRDAGVQVSEMPSTNGFYPADMDPKSGIYFK